jgi:hypothetical protein
LSNSYQFVDLLFDVQVSLRKSSGRRNLDRREKRQLALESKFSVLGYYGLGRSI